MRGSLRVAIVTPRYPPAIGGVEHHVGMLATALARRGISVEVVATDPTGTLSPDESLDGVTVHRFPTLANDGTYFLSPGLKRWLCCNVRRFDLLHAHSYHTPLPMLAALAVRGTAIPLVLTPHFHGTGHSIFRRALHLPYRVAGAWLMSRADAVICVSTVEGQLLERQFHVRDKLQLIPNGVDVQPLRSTSPFARIPGKTTVLAVGRLELYKHHDRLVRALVRLPPEYEAIVIGEGPASTQLSGLASRQGVGQRIRFLGAVSRPELLAWYRTADVFVTMSHREAFGLTLLEAALAGAPVVASDIPAHREVSNYVPEGRVVLVNPMCSDDDLASVIRDAARRGRLDTVDDTFTPTWEQAADRTLACYQAVVSTPDSPSRPRDLAP